MIQGARSKSNRKSEEKLRREKSEAAQRGMVDDSLPTISQPFSVRLAVNSRVVMDGRRIRIRRARLLCVLTADDGDIRPLSFRLRVSSLADPFSSHRQSTRYCSAYD